MHNLDTSMQSYKIAFESFALVSMDQPVSDRLTYRSSAMEAIAGPDSGMVLEMLYKSVQARSGINFGKIPDSMGDITSFQNYKNITSTFDLLDKDLSPLNIAEYNMARVLHDNLIRLRADFNYGFKVDNQFLKMTYNTMVYSLLEMLNLCVVIYVDYLKGATTGKPFSYKGYKDLLLVQSVDKFNKMVKSGEWAQVVSNIQKDASNLLGGLSSDDTKVLVEVGKFIVGSGASIGVLGATLKAGAAYATNENRAALAAAAAAGEDASKVGMMNVLQGTKKVITNGASRLWHSGPIGKIVSVVLILVAALFLIRGLVCIFFKAKYKLRDVLDDNTRVLAVAMDNDKDNDENSLEKQRKLYNALSAIRNKIEKSIVNDDNTGKKEAKESNATDMSRSNFERSTDTASDDISFG